MSTQKVVGWNRMQSFELVSYKGKTIVSVDISNTTTEQLVAVLKEAQQKISKMPANSALIMTDATKAAYNMETGAAIKEFAAKNTPYVKASAVVGVEGIKAVLQTAVSMQNKRNIASFPTRKEAMDWLATV